MTQEFNYFKNGETSKLFDLTLALTIELHITQQKLHGLESLLVQRGALAAQDLNSFVPSGEEIANSQALRDQLMGRIMDILKEDGPAEHPLRQEWSARLSS